MTMTYGHPGEEGKELGIYARHRIVTLHGYGLGAGYIAEYLGLPLFTVESVLREADEEGSREW